MDEWKSIIFLVGVPLALRVVDAILPRGHHLRFMSRYLDKHKEIDSDSTP